MGYNKAADDFRLLTAVWQLQDIGERKVLYAENIEVNTLNVGVYVLGL